MLEIINQDNKEVITFSVHTGSGLKRNKSVLHCQSVIKHPLKTAVKTRKKVEATDQDPQVWLLNANGYKNFNYQCWNVWPWGVAVLAVQIMEGVHYAPIRISETRSVYNDINFSIIILFPSTNWTWVRCVIVQA